MRALIALLLACTLLTGTASAGVITSWWRTTAFYDDGSYVTVTGAWINLAPEEWFWWDGVLAMHIPCWTSVDELYCPTGSCEAARYAPPLTMPSCASYAILNGATAGDLLQTVEP
jgi:hypothetical protein